jgi:hypothetical protein
MDESARELHKKHLDLVSSIASFISPSLKNIECINEIIDNMRRLSQNAKHVRSHSRCLYTLGDSQQQVFLVFYSLLHPSTGCIKDDPRVYGHALAFLDTKFDCENSTNRCFC